MGEQFQKLVSLDNLTLAYCRIKTSSANEYKNFYRADFSSFELYIEMNMEHLSKEITENIFEPSNCEKYFVPKKRNLARPMTLLALPDLIVYQAISNIIADVVHPRLSRYFNVNAFGNIFIKSDASNSHFFFEKWKQQWKRYKNKKTSAYNKGFEYCMEFDIASYYDTIDHEMLFAILKKYGIEDDILALLGKCLSKWTTTSFQWIDFPKKCGIPQGPICSALLAEIYLFLIDEEMRKRHQISYFRYADDITIMAKTEDECKKMVVYLDLLARELALIPQSEKIKITRILDINTHINDVTARFSNIAKEYAGNEKKLNDKTHNKLKKQFLKCFEDDDLNKTIIKFALFKLNKDDEIKQLLLVHIKDLELFYDGIIFYFNKHYPNDVDFKTHIADYLLGETVLFQYNKSLLFKQYDWLDYDKEIFNSNAKGTEPFWIINYRLIDWLVRNDKTALAITSYESNQHYFIRQKVNALKAEMLSDIEAKRIFLEEIIFDSSPMVSLQGIHLWEQYMPFTPLPQGKGNNGYADIILRGVTSDYFSHTFEKVYKLTPPESFIKIIGEVDNAQKEVRESLQRFLSFKESNPPGSLMNLDLLHETLFEAIAHDKGYTVTDFGGSMEQMQVDFPAAFYSFDKIHQMRNQRTDAHRKDRYGNPRIRIELKEYEQLLNESLLDDAYAEIFNYYSAI